MKCIGNYFKKCICFGLIGVTVTGCSFVGDKEVVSAYETEQYNKNLYEADLFASNLCVASQDVPLDGAPDTEALHSAALFNLSESTVNFAYDMYAQVFPASTTKIMTALVAIKNADLSDIVTVSAQADSGTFAADEQTCGIKAGDQLTLGDLLYGLLLYSGNDNAVAIAEYVGGDMDTFAQMMNDEAGRLQATGTHFLNSSGLHDAEHYTTAYDLYLIFNECIKQEQFMEIIGTNAYTANITGADGAVRQITWKPTNFYATGETALPAKCTVIGGKTGTTKPAGNCLILLVEGEGQTPYISIVMGADTKELLYQDMTALVNAI